MALEWYEWKCPHCRRYGQVNYAKEYEDGEHWAQTCPVCGAEIVVLCSYEPVFYAYRKKNLGGGERMTETFAAIGVFSTFAVAAIMLITVAALLITSIKNWLAAKNEIVRTTKSLSAMQTKLMLAHNDLRKRLDELESEVRDD